MPISKKERRITLMPKYRIIVWNENYSFENYDDLVYRKPHAEIDYLNTVKAWTEAKDKTSLIELWKKFLKTYEGYTYCIRDMSDDHIMVGGVYDPNDIDIIEDYFS